LLFQKNFNELYFEAIDLWAKGDLDERKDAFCEKFLSFDLSVCTESFLVKAAHNEVKV